MTVLALLLAVPMLRLNGHALTIATLGLGRIAQIVLVNEVAWTGGPDGLATPPLTIGGIAIDTDMRWYDVVATVLLIAMTLSRNLDRSAAGRALRTVRDSEIAASAAGIDTYRLKVRAFVVSAAFAAVAGALSGHYTGFITPDMTSFLKNVELATMVVVGGRGSTLGAVLGAAAAVVLTRLMQSLLFEIAPTDPLTFTIATLVLIVAAGVACYVPARRASRLDPALILRD